MSTQKEDHMTKMSDQYEDAMRYWLKMMQLRAEQDGARVCRCEYCETARATILVEGGAR